MVTRGLTCSSVSSKLPARCTKLMEKVSTTYKLTDGVLVTVMHIIKLRVAHVGIDWNENATAQ